MEHGKDCMCHLCLPGQAPPPNPPPAGDNGEPTRTDTERRVPTQEGNKEGDKTRDYTRAVYQNLMAVVDWLEVKYPVPVSQKQIQEALKLSKSVVFDICWNLCFRGWAEDMGEGRIMRRFSTSDNDARLGREVKKLVELACGVILIDKRKD